MRPLTVFFVTTLSCFIATADAQRPRAHEQLYAQLCANCHGADGAGGQGPSLIDDVWTHGSDDNSIARVIAQGSGAGTMPAYGEVLADDQIVSLIVLMRELRNRPQLDAAKEAAAGNNGRYTTDLADFTLTEIFTIDGILWGLAFLPDCLLYTSDAADE